MRRITIRQAFLGANLCLGIVNMLVLALGGQLLHSSVLAWSHIFYIGGLFTGLFFIENLVLLSVWILPHLKQLTRTEASLGTQEFSHFPSASRIYELHVLARFQRANIEYVRELIRATQELFEKTGQQKSMPQVKADTVQQIFRKLTETITTLENRIEEITKGNLFVDTPAESQETRVGTAFLRMTGEIRKFVTNIRKEVNNISTASARIAALSQQSSRNSDIETEAVELISSSISQVANNLREVIDNITRQSKSLDGTFAAINKMSDSINDIDRDIELLSVAAEATSHSIGEIHKYMQEIEDHAQESAQISETVANEAKDGGKAVEAVIHGIHSIKTTVEDAATTMERLGAESDRIGEILSVINEIAEQTNLLALNASIIAAQAGEHGRGFSVVADEIKDLANRTRASTQEIGEIIRSVQTEVSQGMSAMQLCLKAVDEGVGLANYAEEILQEIMQGIQKSREMVTTMAKATVKQTENNLQVKQATDQISQRLEGLRVIADNQATESNQLAKEANALQEITHQIDRSAIAQVQETDTIEKSIQKIQELVQRSSRMTHQLAESSNGLGILEGNLAENIGRFFIKKQQLPPQFEQSRPTIALLRQGSHQFYDLVQNGFQDTALPTPYQVITLNSQSDPVVQAENVNWLLQQHWLRGLVIAPVDEYSGSRLAGNFRQKKLPVVAVDVYLENAQVSVISDNDLGGQYAAEMLSEVLPEKHVVLVCGFRNISSVNHRMRGFFSKALSYDWRIIEIYASVGNIHQAKENILEGLEVAQDAEGIFLSNETIVLAYLELLREGKLSGRSLHAVGFDFTAQIAKAIVDGYLVGTIVQDPFQLGKVAMEHLLRMLQEQYPEKFLKSKEVLIPIKKINKENLPSG